MIPMSAPAPDGCAQATSPDWSSFEQTAWRKVCGGFEVVGSCDEQTKLTTDFFNDISRLPYLNFIRNKAISISHALIVEKQAPSLPIYISKIVGRDVEISLCPTPASATFNEIDAEGDLRLWAEEGDVNVFKLQAKNVAISVGYHVTLTSSEIAGSLGIYFEPTHRDDLVQSVTVLGATIGGGVTITDDVPSKDTPKMRRQIEMDQDRIKESVWINRATSLRMNRTRIGDVLTLDIDDGGDLDLSLCEIGTLQLDRGGSYTLFKGRQSISETKIGALVADAGFPFVPFAQRNSSYNANLYDIGVARLRELGAQAAAREVQYYKNYDEIPELPLAYKIISYVKLITSGFGLYPEYGLYLFGVLILMLWVVCLTGTASLVDPTKKPSSWLVFAVDSFIPVFSVDESFKDVEFDGWRRWMLYGARILGIVFAFVILKVLEKLFEAQ